MSVPRSSLYRRRKASSASEPHDVRAHLHGGIPVCEIDLLSGYFDHYFGLRSLLFQARPSISPRPASGRRVGGEGVYVDFFPA